MQFFLLVSVVAAVGGAVGDVEQVFTAFIQTDHEMMFQKAESGADPWSINYTNTSYSTLYSPELGDNNNGWWCDGMDMESYALSYNYCNQTCCETYAGDEGYPFYMTKYVGSTDRYVCYLRDSCDSTYEAPGGGSWLVFEMKTCTTPNTTGYNFTDAAGTMSVYGFAPSGVTCATGFSGSVTYAVCDADGEAYSVSGCGTWTQYVTDNARCTADCDTADFTEVEDETACQTLAEEAGYSWYQYHDSSYKNVCAIQSSCNTTTIDEYFEWAVMYCDGCSF